MLKAWRRSVADLVAGVKHPSVPAWWAGLVVLFLSLLVLCVGVLPPYFAKRTRLVLDQRLVAQKWEKAEDLLKAEELRLKAEEARVKAENDVRTTLLQGLGGLVLLGGAIVAWQQVRVSREGQITERFTRAVEQLGHKSLDVRLGAIYALARIAHQSSHERQAIVEILTAYVRTHARRTDARDAIALEQLPPLGTRSPDVQAAVGELGRRSLPQGEVSARWELVAKPADMTWQVEWVTPALLELSGVDLRKAHLASARLALANFSNANLDGANLFKANLTAADLSNASLRRARFEAACLKQTMLLGTHLEGANLAGSMDLDSRTALGVWVDRDTVWPDNFKPGPLSVRHVEQAPAPGTTKPEPA